MRREERSKAPRRVSTQKQPMLSRPFEKQFCALPGAHNAHFLLQVLSWQPAGAPHCTTCVKGRAGNHSQAPNCWTGSWSHGNPSWPYWGQWQSARGLQPSQGFIHREQGGEEPWITTAPLKVYAPFDEKELEIKVKSIPNTLSGCCLAERWGLMQGHGLCACLACLAEGMPIWCPEPGHPTSAAASLTTPSVQDLLLFFRFYLNTVVFFPGVRGQHCPVNLGN